VTPNVELWKKKMHKIFLGLSKLKTSSGFFVMLTFVFIYFAFYAIRGERGFLKYMALNKEVAQARVLEAKYAKEKEAWTDKVKRLSSESLDLDMLDEQARLVLNMIGQKEFVILDSDLDE